MTGPGERVPWRRPGRTAAATAVFLLLAVIHTWPLATDPGGLSRNDNADTMLNTWIVAWVGSQLPSDPRSLFDTNIFHPHAHTLTYSEPLIVPGAMAIPVLGLGASAVLTYNLLLLVGFTLTALAMYVLVRAWTGDWWAAVLAGALLAFNAHSMTRLPHMQAIHVQWLPLAIWSLDRVLSGQRTRDGLWLSLWIVLAALTSGYLAVFVVFAVGVGAAARIPEWWGRRGRPALIRLAAAACGAFVVSTALLWPYRQVRVEEGVRRSLDSVAVYSASLWSYFSTTASFHYEVWSHRVYGELTEEALFPGVLALGLAVVALVRGSPSGAPRRRMCLAIAAAGLVLSMGTSTPLYAWVYQAFPPMQGIRAAARFGVLVLLAVAALAGMGLATVRRRLSPRAGLVAGVVALAVVTGEALHAPLDLEPYEGIPALYDEIAQDPEAGVVLELPIFGGQTFHRNAGYVLASTKHWRPLVNGYSGRRPGVFDDDATLLNRLPARAAMTRLGELDVRWVIVHEDLYRDPARGQTVVQRLDRHGRFVPVGREGPMRLYRVREPRRIR